MHKLLFTWATISAISMLATAPWANGQESIRKVGPPVVVDVARALAEIEADEAMSGRFLKMVKTYQEDLARKVAAAVGAKKALAEANIALESGPRNAEGLRAAREKRNAAAANWEKADADARKFRDVGAASMTKEYAAHKRKMFTEIQSAAVSIAATRGAAAIFDKSATAPATGLPSLLWSDYDDITLEAVQAVKSSAAKSTMPAKQK